MPQEQQYLLMRTTQFRQIYGCEPPAVCVKSDPNGRSFIRVGVQQWCETITEENEPDYYLHVPQWLWDRFAHMEPVEAVEQIEALRRR